MFQYKDNGISPHNIIDHHNQQNIGHSIKPFTVDAFNGYGSPFIHHHQAFLIILSIIIMISLMLLSLLKIKDKVSIAVAYFAILLCGFFAIIGFSLADVGQRLDSHKIVQTVEKSYPIEYASSDEQQVTSYTFGFRAINTQTKIPLQCYLKPINTKNYHHYTATINCYYLTKDSLNPEVRNPIIDMDGLPNPRSK